MPEWDSWWEAFGEYETYMAERVRSGQISGWSGVEYRTLQSFVSWLEGQVTLPLGLTSEHALYRDALQSIVEKVDDWNSSRRGGLAVQRKRWQILGRMAREALG